MYIVVICSCRKPTQLTKKINVRDKINKMNNDNNKKSHKIIFLSWFPNEQQNKNKSDVNNGNFRPITFEIGSVKSIPVSNWLPPKIQTKFHPRFYVVMTDILICFSDYK